MPARLRRKNSPVGRACGVSNSKTLKPVRISVRNKEKLRTQVISTVPQLVTIKKQCEGKTESSMNNSSKDNKSFLSKQCLMIGHMNAGSINNKAELISKCIKDKGMDICAISETWLKGSMDDRASCHSIMPDGYSISHVSRGTRGGGVAIVYRNTLTVKHPQTTRYHSFEHMEVRVEAGPLCIRLVVIYRPPRLNKSAFLREFESYVSGLSKTDGKLIIVGDFNMHMLADTTSHRMLKELLQTLNLHQHINEKTHKYGGWLDLLMTREEELTLYNLKVKEVAFTDHYLITFCTPCQTKRGSKRNKDTHKCQVISAGSDEESPWCSGCPVIASTQGPQQAYPCAEESHPWPTTWALDIREVKQRRWVAWRTLSENNARGGETDID